VRSEVGVAGSAVATGCAGPPVIPPVRSVSGGLPPFPVGGSGAGRTLGRRGTVRLGSGVLAPTLGRPVGTVWRGPRYRPLPASAPDPVSAMPPPLGAMAVDAASPSRNGPVNSPGPPPPVRVAVVAAAPDGINGDVASGCDDRVSSARLSAAAVGVPGTARTSTGAPSGAVSTSGLRWRPGCCRGVRTGRPEAAPLAVLMATHASASRRVDVRAGTRGVRPVQNCPFR